MTPLASPAPAARLTAAPAASAPLVAPVVVAAAPVTTPALSPFTRSPQPQQSSSRSVAELEAALGMQQDLLEEERVAFALALAQSNAAVAGVVESAVSAASSKWELRVAELQRAVEGEKLRAIELDTLAMEVVSAHEQDKAAWALERQRMLAEAELGYAGLARTVSERAEATIAALRSELNGYAQALDAERLRADEASEAAAQGGKRSIAAAVEPVRRQLAAEQAHAAATEAQLQRQLQSLVRDAHVARTELISAVESEAADAIEEARAEAVAARAEAVAARAAAEAQRRAHAGALERLRAEYEAQARGFESRLRARVSRTISLLRSSTEQPDLAAILSPLMASTVPMPPFMGGGAKEGQTPPPTIAQPVFVGSVASSPEPSPVPRERPAARAGTSAESEQADRLLVAADDILGAVLAGMSAEQRHIFWQGGQR